MESTTPLPEIATQRLYNQGLLQANHTGISAIVAHLGAVQAQDYAMAKWALGARLPGVTDTIIEEAIDKGEIIRTHILRPTWHFVSAPDLRWMLALTAPHIKRLLVRVNQQFGLTDAVCLKSNKIIAKTLENRQLTREELMSELQKHNIPTDELRSTHLMFSAELEGIVCNGSRRGKQFTYALLDERVPPAKPLHKEEALAKLALRYFTSHGPATLKDFAWWSGLPAADARNALESAKSGLHAEKIGATEYWYPLSDKMPLVAANSVHFLPAFDEFMVGYTDRSASLNPAFTKSAITGNGIFKPIIVVNGKVIGLWKRSVKKDRVSVETFYFDPRERLKKNAALTATEPFGAFLGLKTVLI